MAITLSGTYTSYVLSNPTVQNPATVTSSGRIAVNSPTAGAVGLLGTSGFAWTVSNAGTIESTGSTGVGVQLTAGGHLTNSASGLVAGTSVGLYVGGAAGTLVNRGSISQTGTSGGRNAVQMTAGGTVTNGSALLTTASITGDVDVGTGIRISGASGTVSNFGTIAGGIGVELDGGGRITNGSSTSTAATISGSSLAGVYVFNAAGTVVNFGSIGGFFSGVRMAAGGTVVNKVGASLTAGAQGVALAIVGGTGVVTNLGTIEGGGGLFLGAGGTVTNGSTTVSTALIEAGPFNTGIRVAIDGGTIENWATITGYTAVIFDAAGKLTNRSTGSIQGIGSGSVGVIGGDITATNFGTISGAVGLYLGAAKVTNGSASSTTATIAGSSGAAVRTGGVSTIANFGSIAGYRGVQLTGGGTVTNGSATSTVASIVGNVLGGVVFSVGGPTGDVVNFGSISGAYGVGLGGGGSVTNGSSTSTTASIFSPFSFGVDVNGAAGTITNFGQITGATGIRLAAGGTVKNGSGASPSGSILATGLTGIGVEISAGVTTISNAGTISGNTGVFVAGTGAAIVSTSGTIASTAGSTGMAVQLGSGDDEVIVKPGAVFIGKVDAAGGSDLLSFTQAGALGLARFSGFENIELADGGPNTLALSNANFAGVTGASISVFGGDGNDTVNASGLASTNVLVFTGAAGADQATGGSGADTLNGGSGDDTLSGGQGNDLLNGGEGKDTLKGAAGVDTLNGNSGQDLLAGGIGNDLLTGGVGLDSFLFDTALNAVTNVDQIFDFSSVDDMILLSAAIFTAAGPPGTLAPGTFVIGAGPSDADDRIIYNTATGALRYDQDGTGAAAQKQFAVLSTGLALTNNNFQIV
jgi:Ca2+-binding RTX toxin-like protein